MFKLNKYLITLIAFSISPHDALGGEYSSYFFTEEPIFDSSTPHDALGFLKIAQPFREEFLTDYSAPTVYKWEPAAQTSPTEGIDPFEQVLNLLTRRPVTFGNDTTATYRFTSSKFPGEGNFLTRIGPKAAESSNPTIKAFQHSPVTTPETIKFIAAEGKLLSETQKESNIINDAVWALLASVNKKRPSCWIHTTHGDFHVSFQPASPDSTMSTLRTEETIICASESFHNKMTSRDLR